MRDSVIKVKNITKLYKLYNKPTDRLKESLNPFGKKYHNNFEALKDVSIEIYKGETVGIIGQNGSGKSTLLKIITGILTPTIGTVEVIGKVSALLELGAGFNPEMTGLENIYLNGSIMGLSKEHIDKKLDSILEFADIGEFIKQPVKMYSSGMFVRLAFAVAVNIDPEILIVDEALSVGDIRFQQKCYRKIRDFKNNGTVVMVSHDLGAIANFCDRVIWINEGKILKVGTPEEVMDDYHTFMNYGELLEISKKEVTASSEKNEFVTDIMSLSKEAKSFGQKGAEIIGVSIHKGSGIATTYVESGEEVKLRLEILANKTIELPLIGFILKDRLGNSLVISNTEFENKIAENLEKDRRYVYSWSFNFPKIRDGIYTFDVAIAEGTYHNHIQHHWVDDAYIIEVKNKKRYANSQGLLILDDVKLEIL